MLSCKKIDPERDFEAGVYLSEAQNPIIPSPYTLYTCIQNTFSLRDRGSVGEFNHREGGRGNSSHSWVEDTNMTD